MARRPQESTTRPTRFRETLHMLYPVRVVALGLAVSQIIATALVYLSNRGLAQKIAAVSAAGYGPLPGADIDPSLSSFEAAFAGGAFFTLSTGAGVVLLAFGGALLIAALPPIYRVFKLAVLQPGRRIVALATLLPVFVSGAALVIVWPLLLILANLRGFCPGLTAFLLLVPPPVIWAAAKWSPRKSGQARLPWRHPFHFMLIVILLGLWASHISPDVFVDLKDNLLLTSRAGTRVVDFYYRYTLYPAEVFKRLSDKQIKTCVLEGIGKPATAHRLERILRRHDYFVVPQGQAKADLKLVARGERLELWRGGGSVMTVDERRFLASDAEILERFSRMTDNNRVFRRFTIISLLAVAPLVLYLTTYAVFCLIPGLLTGIGIASFLVPLLCFGFWTGAMTVLDTPPVTEMSLARAAVAIREGTRRERLAALRFIHEEKLDLADFAGYRGLLDTGDYALRYWLVSNLGYSRDPAAVAALNRFLNAESAYIVCKAIEAAGRKANRPATTAGRDFRKILRQKINAGDNWYVQFYAYKTLRETGWTPEKSD